MAPKKKPTAPKKKAAGKKSSQRKDEISMDDLKKVAGGRARSIHGRKLP
jgi:hypothetical protein